MILQKLASAIRRQDWFQVLIEVLIVIVGIFLGLQVQSWNEGRLDRLEEHQYLVRLHDDITNSIISNEVRLEFMQRQDSYSRIMLDELSRCQLAPENETVFANGLFVMGKNLPPTLFRNVMDELNSAGKTTILRNVELRNALAEHTAYLDETINVDDKIALRTIPHIIKIDNKFVFNISEPKVGDEEVGVDEIIFDFDKLCKDEEFSKSISLVKAYSYDALARVELVTKQQQELLLFIEEELRKFQ